MSVRKHPTKAGWYQIVVSRGRSQKQKVIKFQGTEAEARALDAEIKGIPAEPQESRVVDLTGRFFDWYSLHRSPNSHSGALWAFGWLLPILGNCYVSLLRQSDYDRYKLKRLMTDKVCKRTINIELTYFRAFLRWCESEKGFPPMVYPKLFPKKDTRPKAIVVTSRDETEDILDGLKGDKRTIAALMAHCGLRRNEALNMKRENVDLANGLLIITGKGNKTRAVSIIGEDLKKALELACKKKKQDDYLFINKKTGAPYKNIRRTIKYAAKKAGIEKRVYNHLLRHAYGTSAIASGMKPRAVQISMGHSEISTTMIYEHMAAEMVIDESKKLEEYLKGKDAEKKG